MTEDPALQDAPHRIAAALARMRIVVPEGLRVGALFQEARHLAGRAAREPDPAAAVILAPFAPLSVMHDAAATARLFDGPPEVLDAIRAGRGLAVVDGANEGRPLRAVVRAGHVANLHAGLAAAGLPPERVVWVQQNRVLAPAYAAYCAEQGIAPMRVVVAHSHAGVLWRRLGRGPTPGWRLGFAAEHDGPRRHRWVCLNYNLRPHRALLVAWLLDRPEPGFLSFSATRETHLRTREGRLLAGVAALDPADPDGARAAVRRLMDSRLHHGSDIDGFASPSERVYSLPVEDVAAAELFIVTETEMEGPDMLRWTEKTLKAIGSGLPVVVFGNAGVVAALEALGFDLLRDLVDHGYDAEPEPARRFAAARDSVARFLARPPGFTPAELARLRAASAHNRAAFDRALPQDSLVAPIEAIAALAGG
ncbi:hypothetical protein [Roseomonas fluvialis]|uniref:Uncharacterized protein n=1 Tax=Roseomonas fluvialis TaxID=1750527 RepID=A0ABM7Y5A6_9PROT|nr:hypothetical protein [Roseomonas fluvialis]BDG73039.1 hypothetical protein Rmf_29680 [Roseomonas fluvialis]